MEIGGYELIAPIGPGMHGTAYRARTLRDGSSVELHLLDAGADDRYQMSARRLRIAQLVRDRSCRQILELQLDRDPRFAALEPVEAITLHDAWSKSAARTGAATLEIGLELARALGAAHRLALPHGCLNPRTIRMTASNTPIIDFVGAEIAIGSPEKNHDSIASFRAPEVSNGAPADACADIYSLGAVLQWCVAAITGRDVAFPSGLRESFDRLLQRMMDDDPIARPWASEVEDQLEDMLLGLEGSGLLEIASPADPPDASQEFHLPAAVTRAPKEHQLARDRLRQRFKRERDSHSGVRLGDDEDSLSYEQLGRYRLLERFGKGGMGAVYRAEDVIDGAVVAIKVIRPMWARDPGAIRRLQKEARILGEADNPYVTNLHDVNEDHGVHYLVLEFVAGRSLGQWLDERHDPLDETIALAIMADVARALVTAHEQGIVHRDVKPDNILIIDRALESAESLVETPGTGSQPWSGRQLVKLSDFGLARHIVQTDSMQLTGSNVFVGTPAYMAPEQCIVGGILDSRTDVYSMAITLYQLLAGRPPFLGATAALIMAMHTGTPVPPIQTFNPKVQDATDNVLRKALSKSPDARHQNAAEFLHDLDCLLRGEPTSIVVHPRLPACDPRKILKYDWKWELQASPQQIWPYVSDTERVNRAVGLPAVHYRAEPNPDGGVYRQAEFRWVGGKVEWQEHPFEWVEARRMGVLREYYSGPFRWLLSIVSMSARPNGGSLLVHEIRLEPRGVLGQIAAALEVKLKGHRAFDRVYRRIDSVLARQLDPSECISPFQKAAPLTGSERRHLDQTLERMRVIPVEPAVINAIESFVLHGSPQDLARIRPLELARRFQLESDATIAACLHGARAGMFAMLWDVVCPKCRIPADVKGMLRNLREHGHCPACNIDFRIDFADSVEMIFQISPRIRATDLQTYCIGGPAHSPHVVAQIRVAPGERLELELGLSPGSYCIRSPQLPTVFGFTVKTSATTARWYLSLAKGLDPETPRSLKVGAQVIVMTNEHPRELLIRVERNTPREEVFTAAKASSNAIFRELFPQEVLSPGQLVSLATITLLCTRLVEADRLYQSEGDAKAFARLQEHFQQADEAVRNEGGTLVKTVDEGVRAAFTEPAAAVRAALELLRITSGGAADCRLGVAVHVGPAMVATINEHLDYFGTTVRQAERLLNLAAADQLLLSREVAADPQVAGVLRERALIASVADGVFDSQLAPVEMLTLSAPASDRSEPVDD